MYLDPRFRLKLNGLYNSIFSHKYGYDKKGTPLWSGCKFILIVLVYVIVYFYQKCKILVADSLGKP